MNLDMNPVTTIYWSCRPGNLVFPFNSDPNKILSSERYVAKGIREWYSTLLPRVWSLCFHMKSLCGDDQVKIFPGELTKVILMSCFEPGTLNIHEPLTVSGSDEVERWWLDPFKNVSIEFKPQIPVPDDEIYVVCGSKYAVIKIFDLKIL